MPHTQRAHRGPLNIEPRIVMPAPLGGLEAGRVARSALYATLYHVLWQGCVERRCIYQSLQQKCTPTTHHGAIRAKRRRAAARRVPAPPAPHPHLQLHLLLRVRLRRMGRRRRRFGGGGGGGGPRLGRRRRRGRERASRRQRLLRPPV